MQADANKERAGGDLEMQRSHVAAAHGPRSSVDREIDFDTQRHGKL
jgi:hypothetical protein